MRKFLFSIGFRRLISYLWGYFKRLNKIVVKLVLNVLAVRLVSRRFFILYFVDKSLRLLNCVLYLCFNYLHLKRRLCYRQ